MKTKYYYIIAFIFCFNLTSCKKSWLEEKRDITLVVPTTLNDLRLLLNNDDQLSYEGRGITEVACDDIYATPALFNAFFREMERNAFVWNADVFGSANNVLEWDVSYNQVLISNVVLDALNKINLTDANKSEYNSIKGGALFYRSRAFLNLAITFCKYYDPATANTDLGIPLKLSSDISETVKRASLQQTYDQITQDLLLATQLLPNTATTSVDPSKVTANALLARCYLFMDKYEEALEAATSSYALHNILIDFNSLRAATSRPIPSTNKESHMITMLVNGYTSQYTGAYISSELYSLYDPNDLRRTMYFTVPNNGAVTFRGSFLGNGNLFGGTTTGEMLLIMAECKARLNDVSGAMANLNTLLISRWSNKVFYPALTATSPEDALIIVLRERRKELLKRGLRLQDLKRLNRDQRFAKMLVRTLEDKTFTLPPNDPRYVFPIPQYVISYNQIQQNPR